MLLKTIRCKSVNSSSLSIFIVCLPTNPISSANFPPFGVLSFFPSFFLYLFLYIRLQPFRELSSKEKNHLYLTAVTLISVPFFVLSFFFYPKVVGILPEKKMKKNSTIVTTKFCNWIEFLINLYKVMNAWVDQFIFHNT